MKYLLERLREPSTWAGLSVLVSVGAAVAGRPVDPGVVQAGADAGLAIAHAVGGNSQAVMQGLSGLAALVAIFRRG